MQTDKDGRTWAMISRGTPASAPEIRRLLDEIAVNAPEDDFGWALYRWVAEASAILEHWEHR